MVMLLTSIVGVGISRHPSPECCCSVTCGIGAPSRNMRTHRRANESVKAARGEVKNAYQTSVNGKRWAPADATGGAGLDFEDLVTALAPPPNRIGKSDGEQEHHLYEGAVMVAYATGNLAVDWFRSRTILASG
ncbi:hypothetical protein [Ensifer aridi]|uniref:hypothetical protein n=1 Tax=Ensifer aridi TaxID=1708715 RepID=UPI00097C79EB|nr:hypothetical protein [Ensifer aridi]